ncbi:MAG: class I SAM-dependent methyltransferase [Chthoniobacterales bacterium]
MQFLAKSKRQRERRRLVFDIQCAAFDVAALQTGNSELIETIRARISAAGPVSFAWFMEQALYHPDHGYYSSGRARIGRQGDYFTNVSVGPIFGRLMATQFAELWRVLGEPAEFTIVEQGANDGQFARDVFSAAAEVSARFAEAILYRIVEPLPLLRARQIEMLSQFADRAQWSDSLQELEPFCGVHFSNELLDSFPVHLIRWDGREWLERHVTVDAEAAFEFIDAAPSEAIRQQVSLLPTLSVADYETEINIAALDWVRHVASKLQEGFIIAVDYGFPRDEYYAPHRSSGTLQCRAHHRIMPSPLSDVGQADITAHVEWTSIAERAGACGLSLLGYTDQHHFITGLLVESGARLLDDGDNNRALQTLLHPAFLGMNFQYLVLGKNFDRRAKLAGLRFARDPQLALQLSTRA